MNTQEQADAMFDAISKWAKSEIAKSENATLDLLQQLLTQVTELERRVATLEGQRTGEVQQVAQQ